MQFCKQTCDRKCIVYVSSKLLSNLILEGEVVWMVSPRRDVCVYIRSCLVTSLKSRFIKCDEPPKWDFEIVIDLSLEQYYFIESFLTFLYDSRHFQPLQLVSSKNKKLQACLKSGECKYTYY